MITLYFYDEKRNLIQSWFHCNFVPRVDEYVNLWNGTDERYKVYCIEYLARSDGYFADIIVIKI